MGLSEERSGAPSADSAEAADGQAILVRSRDVTRERMLDAAETLFLENGFRTTSVQAIAAAAGYTTGAIYSSFEGKDDLFLAVFQRRARRQESVWREALESVTTAEDAPKVMGDALAKAMPEPAWYGVLFEFLSYAARGDRLQIATDEAYTKPMGFLEEILRDVGDSSPLPLERLAPTILALMRGLAMNWFVNPDAEDFGLFSDAVAVLIGRNPPNSSGSRADGDVS